MGEALILIMFGIVGEFLEELSLVNVPIAVQPGVPHFGRQGLELLDVVRLFPHESGVVLDQRLDEHVVLRLFPLAELALL